MRSLKKITLSGLIFSGATIIGPTAFAADQNTYRAGTPYFKTVASHFSQCESQCSGDAACRSWNFVRPNAGAASGICEFNAQHVTPTSSSVSMSGTMKTRIDPLMSRAVAGGTNTIRIGTPALITPNKAPQQHRRMAIRKPVPRQIVAQKANHARPVNLKPSAQKPKNVTKTDAPRIYGSIVQPTKADQKKSIVGKTANTLTPEQAYYREQYLAQKRQQEILQQQYRQRQQQMVRPTVARQSTTQNLQRQLPPQPIAQGRVQPQQQRPQQVRVPQRPLYGSLHDDLSQNLTRVPRPQTAPDNLKNPDAPLATSRAVPTKPVTAKPLNKPAIADLVGG